MLLNYLVTFSDSLDLYRIGAVFLPVLVDVLLHNIGHSYCPLLEAVGRTVARNLVLHIGTVHAGNLERLTEHIFH